MKIVDTFTPPNPLKTAVLFLVFNRPDTTKQVFEAIRKAKPPRLYVAADGPRENKPGEDEKVKAVRDYVMNNIDWECEVKTLFREKNLGCKYAVSSAITWFFENEEMGIILEDDCLPSQSFFWFCEELLERYKGDERIGHIGGYSLQKDLINTTYRFSRLVPIWGWATWRRAWKLYDIDMRDFDYNNDEIYAHFGKYAKEVKNTFYQHLIKNVDAWGPQWAYTCVKNNMLTIIPKRSLVKNIGFGINATHTKSIDNINKNIDRHELSFPLFHPEYIDESYIKMLDEMYLSLFYKKTLLSKVKSIVKGLTQWKK